MIPGGWKPQASCHHLGRLTLRFTQLPLALLPKVPVDRLASETVEDDTTQKLRVRALGLLSLKRDVARKSDVELHGACVPRARCLARSHSTMSSI